MWVRYKSDLISMINKVNSLDNVMGGLGEK